MENINLRAVSLATNNDIREAAQTTAQRLVDHLASGHSTLETMYQFRQEADRIGPSCQNRQQKELFYDEVASQLQGKSHSKFLVSRYGIASTAVNGAATIAIGSLPLAKAVIIGDKVKMGSLGFLTGSFGTLTLSSLYTALRLVSQSYDLANVSRAITSEKHLLPV